MFTAPPNNFSRDLADQILVREICSAPDAAEAQRRFRDCASVLQDWQILFAENSSAASIKLLDLSLGSSGVATSVFRGKSLWLMDANFVSQDGPMDFRGGSAMFVDSNAASFIRQIAYDDEPSEKALERAMLINHIGPRLRQLNPSLYLWESLRSWNEKTRARCRESVAAIHALSWSDSALSAEWGRRYRAGLRASAEHFAAGVLAEFQRDLAAGRFAGVLQTLDLMEAILIRTQIIELSSDKGRPGKLAQLVTYMHEELSTLMLRELIVCGDILLRSKGSRLANKLNSIQNHPQPLALLRNCAWDMFIPRLLDGLCAATPADPLGLDFYVAELLTLDGDVADIINTTKLRALAVHRPSRMNMPFFDNEVAEWLGNRIGSKHLDGLVDTLDPAAALERAARRPSISFERILQRDRAHLMRLVAERRR